MAVPVPVTADVSGGLCVACLGSRIQIHSPTSDDSRQVHLRSVVPLPRSPSRAQRAVLLGPS